MKIQNVSYSILVSLFTLLFAACAPPGKGESQPGHKTRVCPMDLRVPYHRVNVHTSEPIPKKVAVMVEGVLKYDECLRQPVINDPPITEVARKPGIVSVIVMHLAPIKVLPTSITFEILDRGNCKTAPATYYKGMSIPLVFTNENPDGCGATLSATVDVIR